MGNHSRLPCASPSSSLSDPPKTLSLLSSAARRGGERIERSRRGFGAAAASLIREPCPDMSTGRLVIRPGETVRCDPGEAYCYVSQIAIHAGKRNEDVRIFVKVDGKELLIGTLSVDKYPQHGTDLVFEKEFELLHTSKTSSISVIGYKLFEEGESDEEVPLAIPLYPNADDEKSKETKSRAEKLFAPSRAVAQSSEPKVILEETKIPAKMKADVDGSDDDENDEDFDDSKEGESSDDEISSDEDDSENQDEDSDEDSPKNAKGKNRPIERFLKTPPAKKAKTATPSMSNKTGCGTAKLSGHVHVATPYPSKRVKKTPSIYDNSK
ncbi:hypothetical protein ACP4OV_030183 [Aristida adscensionis]